MVGCDDKEDNCTGYSESEKAKSYEWLISSFGDEEGAMIRQQAKHFKISKVDREKGTYYLLAFLKALTVALPAL